MAAAADQDTVSADVYDTCIEALALLQKLQVRHGLRLPSEYWRARMSLETLALTRPRDPEIDADETFAKVKKAERHFVPRKP